MKKLIILGNVVNVNKSLYFYGKDNIVKPIYTIEEKMKMV